jgi:signal transduction histidine kinase
MNALLDDIIAYNKAELGKVEFYPQYLDIEKFCLNLTREVEMIAKNKSRIDLTVRNGSILANVDENLVRKILVNLLTNAVKYSTDNSVVEFDVNVKKDEVEFVIRDSGFGMSEDTKERLFEPFFRGDNVGTISGTGLGLAVVKSSVDIHKGRIYFDSEIGKGTTFVITIPFYEKSKITKSIFKKHS